MSIHPYDPEGGVHPDFTFALWHFGLISDEQAKEGYAQWERDSEGWQRHFQLAEAAWKQRRWWERLFTFSDLAWKFRWMKDNPEISLRREREEST